MKKNVLLIDFRKDFLDTVEKIFDINFDISAKSVNYDIIAIDESGCILFDNDVRSRCVLCPQISPFRGKIICDTVISCGMSSKSTFGISSLRDDRYIFSVCRTINLPDRIIYPFEEPFKPISTLSPYENIIVQGIYKLL